MAGAQISTSVTILNSLHGFIALSLNEYTTSAAATIAAGSVVEIAGAFFTFAGDEAIEASTWTSIVTGQTAYINLTASGTAGSQIVAATYTNVAPTWRDDLQGWYASAASSVRVIGSVYKAEATNYGPKYLLDNVQESKHLALAARSIAVDWGISVGSCSVASSLTVGGITLVPYRVTTETYIKVGYSALAFTASTSITVYGVLGGWASTASDASWTRPLVAHISAGSLFISTDAGLSTTTTFYVRYWY